MPLPTAITTLIVRQYCQLREQLRESLFPSLAAGHLESSFSFIQILKRMPPVAPVAEFTLRSKIPGKQRR